MYTEYFLLDNVTLSATENISIPVPILEYHFDEPGWNGRADEIIDYSGNDNNAVADATSLTTTDADGAICRAASFNGSDQFITADDLSALRDTATMSFWIKTAQAGSNQPYNSPGVTGIEQSGGVDDIFWGWLNQNGRIGLSVGNDNAAVSTISVNDGDYHHVVLIRDANLDTYRILIDGVERGSGNYSGSGIADVIGNSFDSIGRIEDTAGSPLYLDALIDELLVFDQILTDTQAQQIFTLQSNGQNLDGSIRDCSPPPPAVCFTDNFDRASLDSDWAVTSRSGAFGLPRIVNNRLRITDNSGNVSTAATLYRLFPSAGNRIVVEFDYYAYGDPSDGGDGLALVFSDSEIVPQPGGYGGSLGYAQKDGISGFAGGWMGIGLDEYGNFLNRNDGNKDGGFTTRVRETITIRGSGSGTDGYNYITSNGQVPGSNVLPTSLNPTIENNTGHRYRVTIDHANGVNAWVRVERDIGSGFNDVIATFDLLAQTGQDAIPTRMYMTLTGSTGGATNAHEIDNLNVCADVIERVDVVDHYELDRNVDQGLTCEAVQVASRACMDPNCNTQISGLISTEFAPATGWEASNIKTDYTSGEVFNYRQTVAGDYTFDVISSTPAIRPLSTDPVLCFVNGIQQSDCDITFVDAAYRFFTDATAPASPVSTFDLVAGEATSPFYLRALRTDPDTGVCQSLFTNASLASQLGTTCSNPNTCVSGANVTWDDSVSGGTAVSNTGTTSKTLTFGSNSTSTFGLSAPEVGIQPLAVATELPDADGNPSGEFIRGTVNLRVRPAQLEVFDVRNGSTINDGNGVLAAAGEPFTSAIRALDVNGNILQNFAETTGLYAVDWSLSTLNAPSGGVFGTLSGNAVNQSDATRWQAADRDGNGIDETLAPAVDGSGLPLGITYSEVGRINLVAQIENYLGSGFAVNSLSDPIVTGRFTPAYLQVSENTPGNAEWGSDSALYQGLTEPLTGLSYQVQAYSRNDTLLQNYVGEFVDFDSVVSPLDVPAGTNTEGNGYSSSGAGISSESLIWTIDGDNDTDGVLTFNADLANVLWSRKTGLPTADDTLQSIDTLTLSASAFTDADGICVSASSSPACQNVTLDIDDRSLYYARLSLPDQVDGTNTNAFVPITLEYLSSVNAGEPTFSVQALENDLNNGVFAGLTHNTSQVCTLLNCPPDLSNTQFSGPTGSGSTLESGLGLWTLTLSDTGLVEVNGDVPAWLTWDWDNSGVFRADSTLLLFGNYQGRAPILFTLPGGR
ncbi:DUF6701 domain-containing protein [Reinekea blandensis]|uniref:MshQ n=1 Tax=Reinekea blandensis MED297 TaxID=314283 RepID=A4BJB6_9GAMM|nr:DUF6701 domain-containing protein [Reinekea blandensis]EAR07774.1 MshQ [Reinekea sp. MED297] [Reinekea blandensis MED297]